MFWGLTKAVQVWRALPIGRRIYDSDHEVLIGEQPAGADEEIALAPGESAFPGDLQAAVTAGKKHGQKTLTNDGMRLASYRGTLITPEVNSILCFTFYLLVDIFISKRSIHPRF